MRNVEEEKKKQILILLYVQCDLYKNEIEKLQKLIACKAELIERNEEIYKLHEENNLYLKPVNFHMSI